jgi:hypothetical protein
MPLKTVRVYLSQNEQENVVLKAFCEGCPESKELVSGFDYRPSDIAVIMGVYKKRVPISYPRGNVFRQQRSKNLDVVVLETGYINRGDGENHHYAAGFNGLNGRADFRNKNMPDDRAKLLGVELKPWRDGKYILLCGQVPWDASLEGSDHQLWLQATLERLRSYTQKEVVFRPHPLARGAYGPLDCRVSARSLAEDLAGAHAVVTFNSNTGVDALVNGVPVFAQDQGSMCWSVANKSLISVDVPNKPDRGQWLSDLAYCQWTPAELRSGETWRHLLR